VSEKKTQDEVTVTPGLTVAVLEPAGWGGHVMMVGTVVPEQPHDGPLVHLRVDQVIPGTPADGLYQVGEVVIVSLNQLSVSALEGQE